MENEIKEKIYDIINQLLEISENVKEWVIRNYELKISLNDFICNIFNLLEKDSFEFRKFDNWTRINFSDLSKLNFWIKEIPIPSVDLSYANDDKQITDLLNILKEITLYKEVEWEKHFKELDNYQIIRYFTKLFHNSKSEILIVDNYMDPCIFDYIEGIDNSIKIMILTSKEWVKINFKNLYFDYQWSNLESKLYDIKNHDRYIVIDKKVIYLVWTSFNCFWKSDFTVKKLDDKEKIEYLYDLWNKSKLLENK